MIAALDIGSTKIVCFIARRHGERGLRILGAGQELADGIAAGAVVDMDAAEAAIRRAVHRAEEAASLRVQSVFVGMSGGEPRSRLAQVEMGVSGRIVGDSDIQRALDRAERADRGREHVVVHAAPMGYQLDEAPGIRDPRGLSGRNLRASFHLVSVAHGTIRNLLACVSRCDLEVAAPVVSAYASGLACLEPDERELGAAYVDLGGDVTGLAAFDRGALVWAGSLPLGGNRVTGDIAHGLSTSRAVAERMKRLHGSAVLHSANESGVVALPEIGRAGGAAPRKVPRELLVGIVRPRIEEIFEFVREQFDSNGVGEGAGRRVVVGGGASRLQGVGAIAGRILGREVRIARPLALPGLASAVSGPEFAACAGLLLYAAEKHAEPGAEGLPLPRLPLLGGTAERVGRWLRGNF